MKKLDVVKMENVQGGDIDWCAVGEGVLVLGGSLLEAGFVFAGPWAALAYLGIMGAVAIWC